MPELTAVPTVARMKVVPVKIRNDARTEPFRFVSPKNLAMPALPELHAACSVMALSAVAWCGVAD